MKQLKNLILLIFFFSLSSQLSRIPASSSLLETRLHQIDLIPLTYSFQQGNFEILLKLDSQLYIEAEKLKGLDYFSLQISDDLASSISNGLFDTSTSFYSGLIQAAESQNQDLYLRIDENATITYYYKLFNSGLGVVKPSSFQIQLIAEKLSETEKLARKVNKLSTQVLSLKDSLSNVQRENAEQRSVISSMSKLVMTQNLYPKFQKSLAYSSSFVFTNEDRTAQMSYTDKWTSLKGDTPMKPLQIWKFSVRVDYTSLKKIRIGITETTQELQTYVNQYGTFYHNCEDGLIYRNKTSYVQTKFTNVKLEM